MFCCHKLMQEKCQEKSNQIFLNFHINCHIEIKTNFSNKITHKNYNFPFSSKNESVNNTEFVWVHNRHICDQIVKRWKTFCKCFWIVCIVIELKVDDLRKCMHKYVRIVLGNWFNALCLSLLHWPDCVRAQQGRTDLRCVLCSEWRLHLFCWDAIVWVLCATTL